MAETTPDQIAHYDHDEVADVDYTPPETDWLDTPTDFRPGSWIYPAKAKHCKRCTGVMKSLMACCLCTCKLTGRQARFKRTCWLPLERWRK
jgi:hypothetical protein